MYKKILVRAHNWIGDGVMATSTLSALRQSFKDAEIVLLAKPAVAALLESQPEIDRIIRYEKPGKDAGLLGFWRLTRFLRAENFDLAFLLQNAIEAALIASFAGIPHRVGFATDGRKLFLTKSLNLREAPRHCRERYLSLISLVSDRTEKRDPYLVVTSEERKAARLLLESEGISGSRPLVGINPGAAYGTAKRWHPERFAEVADRLLEKYNSQSLIFWGPGELEIAETVQKKMHHRSLVLSRKTTVREMMALITKCHLFVSNDSGPMHIASALGVPQVVIFGPTDPEAYFPNGKHDSMFQEQVDCFPCQHRTCPIDHRCMERVTVDLVFEGASEKLNASVNKKGAVFLDRDGTINYDGEGYIDSIKRFALLPGAAEAIAKLNREGIPVILVTNQSGIARGYFKEAFLGDLHRYLQRLLARVGAHIDGIYYCPHHPDFSFCTCRKPAMGMIEQAVIDYRIDLSKSYIVGDTPIDMALAQRGAKSILVQTGKGLPSFEAMKQLGKQPDYVSKDLNAASDWIVTDVHGDEHGH